MTMASHHKILIVGGGTGGICVAARLAKAGLAADVAVVEPCQTHYYQPLWTLVGAGIFSFEESARPMKRLIPEGVIWHQDAAIKISGEQKVVVLASSKILTYDWLVLAPGVELDWDAITGARDAINRPNVSCIYAPDYVVKTKSAIESAKNGRLIFTFPTPPVKCAGAPQKIMYLADEILRKKGNREQVEIQYRSALGGVFGIPVFAEVLNKVIQRKGIKTFYNQKLVEVRSTENIAVFADLATGKDLELVSYDYLHLIPPMHPPLMIRDSDVSIAAGPGKGWIDVDPFTLRHQRWSNIFALGDACNAPNAKTGAAIRKQAPVLVDHLLQAMTGGHSKKIYDGYASCPLVTGFGKVVLAEFGYDGKVMPSFPWNQAKESRLMWWLKTLILPRLYWYLMLRGRA
jgi:sulfide:quinone oxidoreductase